MRHAAWFLLCLSALAAISAPAPVAAASHGEPVHVALRSSTPAPNDTLTTAPRQIRLDFTQAVEIPLARIELFGADSANIALPSARAADTTDRAIVTDVPATLGAGTYRVHWTVTSRDSHTIRGDFLFTVLASAADTTVVAAMDADTIPAAARFDTTSDAVARGEFDARSPAYAAIRGLTYVGILGIAGALFFGVGVVPSVQRRLAPEDNAAQEALERALSRARVGAMGAGTLLLLAGTLRLLAQVRAVFGELTLDWATISPLLVGTAWGRGWIAQVCAAVVALGVVARRPDLRRDGRVGPIGIAGGLVLLTLVVSAAVSGHAVTASPVYLAVASDAVHLLAVGGWLGTLAYVAFAGIPATKAADPDSRPRLARDIVTTFSNIALVCVAAILATGVVSSWLELRSVSALWTSSYGRVLMLKLVLVALVGAAGAYNWRVATPRLAATGGIARIRTVMIAELLFAVLVLCATVVLTATPPPIDMRVG